MKYSSLQSVHVSRHSFPSTSPVTLAACAVVHSQRVQCPPHNATSYDHLGPESMAQTSRNCVVCISIHVSQVILSEIQLTWSIQLGKTLKKLRLYVQIAKL